jgi:hypothetical protein
MDGQFSAFVLASTSLFVVVFGCCNDQIKDPKRLEAEVLPKYFQHSRFQSLVRRLNFYNFQRVSQSPSQRCIYRHDFFHRDKPVHILPLPCAAISSAHVSC